jgi:tetratricopeptide (TPR) repeat protein
VDVASRVEVAWSGPVVGREARGRNTLRITAFSKFEEAIGEYEAALALNPCDLEILNSLAVDYTRMGQYDLAIAMFEKIQELDANFEPCYCNRIITYTEMGLHVLAYNLKRVMRILGIDGMLAAMRA